ncbi:beta-ketoacyl synthase N-terminal-like domain-containing protein [Mesorhizobium sp. M1322]|uniref:beta-ketoacyl synthase N-terminal-like domain-containing protein n=1 Tax=Mesorhizobium sp. M1322 TaxID=2957081 RepID=UPI003334D88C
MAGLRVPIYVIGGGAVTPAGLNARQTLAAIRASLSAYEQHILADPFGQIQTVSRIPSHYSLRHTQNIWLTSMAARAVGEALEKGGVAAGVSALLLVAPEAFRKHPAFAETPAAEFLTGLQARLGESFHPTSRIVGGGAAACIGLLDQAADLLATQEVEQVLLGGVDSLVNDKDIARLSAANRLKAEDNAQGLVPGEGAAVVCLRRAPSRNLPAQCAIHGVGVALEENSVLSENYSQGTALLAACRAAIDGKGPTESDINFIVSNDNGERYSAWEALIGRSRFYRTRRETLPMAYPAMTVGEIGAGAGALTLLIAADSFAKGYAPGRVAMCEAASEAGMRAAALVSARSSSPS